MLIRDETPADAAAIAVLHAACFPSRFEARLVDRLRAAGRLVVSLVASSGSEISGHVSFSPVTTSNGAVGAGLAPVAVAAAFHRQGIAARLIRSGLDACRSKGWGWCVVLGDPLYYARFGFRSAASFGLFDEYGGGDAFQVLELLPGALPTGSGLVRYAHEFAAKDEG